MKRKQEAGGRKQEAGKDEGQRLLSAGPQNFKRFVPSLLPASCFLPPASCLLLPASRYIATGPLLGGNSSVDGFSSGNPAARRIALSAGRLVSSVFFRADSSASS